MKISAVTNVSGDNKSQKQNNSNKSYSYQTNYLSKSNNQVSFNGLGAKMANGANKIFKFIDRSSFFVEFLIIDTLSMVAPRVGMGLLRDKEQLGHLNWKAAKEEAGREILSGPSMNLIPMGVLAATSALKPASRMERDNLTYLSEIAKSVVDDKFTIVSSDRIAEKIFDSNFKNLESEKENFVKTLSKLTYAPDKKTRKSAIAEFSKIVTNLNNKIAENVAPIDATSIKINNPDLNIKTTSISASDFANSFDAFNKDIIAKVNKKTRVNAKEVSDLIDKLKMNRSALKLGTALTAFLAVGGFLKALPKLYQQQGLSPAQESALRAAGQKTKEGGNA